MYIIADYGKYKSNQIKSPKNYDFQSRLTSSTGSFKGCLDHKYGVCAPPAYTARFQLCINTGSTLLNSSDHTRTGISKLISRCVLKYIYTVSVAKDCFSCHLFLSNTFVLYVPSHRNMWILESNHLFVAEIWLVLLKDHLNLENA